MTTRPASVPSRAVTCWARRARRTACSTSSPAGRAFGNRHHGDLMRRPQVVVQRLGALVGALVVGAGEQILDELAADPQLGVGQPAQPGQLNGQHGGAVLDGHHVRAGRPAARVDQREQAEHPGARRGQGDHAVAVAHRPARRHQPAQQLGPLVGGRLGVGVGLTGAGPGGQVAVPVLDRHGQPGEVVQRLGDAGRALPRGRDPGQPLVDLHAAAQRGHGLLQRLVGLGQRRVGWASCSAMARSRPCSRALDTATPVCWASDLGQELLLAGGLAGRAGHQVADRAGDAAQRVGPGPAAVAGAHLAAAFGQRAQLVVQRGGDGGGAGQVGPPGVPDREPGDPPAAQRRGGGDRQPEDLLVVGALGHQDGQHEQRPEIGQLSPEEAGFMTWGRPVRAHCSTAAWIKVSRTVDQPRACG